MLFKNYKKNTKLFYIVILFFIIFFLNNYQIGILKKQYYKNKLPLLDKCFYFPNFLVKYDGYPIKISKIKNIGLIGRFSSEKNFETVLKNMKHLSDFNLYIAGKDFSKNNENINKYKEIIKNLNLSNIYFMGWVDKNEFYKNVDLIVISSLFEASPMNSIEAMSKGKIIISNKNEGCLENLGSIDDRIFVNDTFSSTEYADKIKFFSKNIDLSNEIILKNYNHFLENFTLKSSKNKLSKFFKQ